MKVKKDQTITYKISLTNQEAYELYWGITAVLKKAGIHSPDTRPIIPSANMLFDLFDELCKVVEVVRE